MFTGSSIFYVKIKISTEYVAMAGLQCTIYYARAVKGI